MRKIRSWVYKIGIGLTVIGALIDGVFPLATETPAEFFGQVIEIRFLVNSEMLGIPDLIQEFERGSLAAHRKNPARPIYRVITGHSGARDISFEPTRFLTRVAGGDPPDVIALNRTFIDLIPHTRILPQIPVAPSLFHWQAIATEEACYGQKSLRQAWTMPMPCSSVIWHG